MRINASNQFSFHVSAGIALARLETCMMEIAEGGIIVYHEAFLKL